MAGGRVVLSEGKFSVASTVNQNKVDSCLSGQGLATVLKPIDNFDSDVLSIAARPVIVENLRIDGNRANQSSGNGIDVGVYSRRSKIRDVWLTQVKDAGIRTHTLGMDLTFSGIQADYCGIGIELWGDGGFLLSDIYITDCELAIYMRSQWINLHNFRITTSESLGRGIVITDAGDMVGGAIVIANGDIDAMQRYAIELHAIAYNLDHVIISGITMSENSMEGNNLYSDIYAHCEAGKAITDIDIHDNYLYGADTKYLIEFDNLVSGNAEIHHNLMTGGVTDKISVPPGVRVHDNPGYVTENSDTSTGTAGEQTIAHGLAIAPTRVYFSNIEDGANPYQSSAADATNIYVTAVAGKDYVWKAEVV